MEVMSVDIDAENWRRSGEPTPAIEPLARPDCGEIVPGASWTVGQSQEFQHAENLDVASRPGSKIHAVRVTKVDRRGVVFRAEYDVACQKQ